MASSIVELEREKILHRWRGPPPLKRRLSYLRNNATITQKDVWRHEVSAFSGAESVEALIKEPSLKQKNICRHEVSLLTGQHFQLCWKPHYVRPAILPVANVKSDTSCRQIFFCFKLGSFVKELSSPSGLTEDFLSWLFQLSKCLHLRSIDFS